MSVAEVRALFRASAKSVGFIEGLARDRRVRRASTVPTRLPLVCWLAPAHSVLLRIVQGETKRVSEGRQRSLRGVGLGRLQGNIVRLTGRKRAAFARARPFSYDGDVAGANSNAHFGDVSALIFLSRSCRSRHSAP